MLLKTRLTMIIIERNVALKVACIAILVHGFESIKLDRCLLLWHSLITTKRQQFS